MLEARIGPRPGGPPTTLDQLGLYCPRLTMLIRGITLLEARGLPEGCMLTSYHSCERLLQPLHDSDTYISRVRADAVQRAEASNIN